MKLKHAWKGDDELRKAFRGLSDAVSDDVALEALLDGGSPIRDEAALLAPRGKGRGPHLADNIVIAKTAFGTGGNAVGPGETAVAIGPRHKPSDHFYGMFQEMGTAHHPAQPFMRPAFDNRRREAGNRIKRAVWAALVRRVKGTR